MTPPSAERPAPAPLPVQVGAPPEDRDPVAAFLVRLGEKLHAYGTRADRLEEALGRCATRLGRRGHFFSTPTSLFVALGEPGAQRTHLVRVSPGEVDLGRLVDLDEVVRDVVERDLSPAEGMRRIDEIERAPLRYGVPATVLSYAVASAAAACFFGGVLLDVVAAGLLSVAIGLLALGGERRPHLGRVVVPLAAFAASAAALVAERATGALSADVTTLSALIVLVPGLTLTVAIKELATGHWVSGTARLAGAGTTFLAIALGIALGQTAAGAVPAPGWPLSPRPMPESALLVALAVAPVAFAVLFRARARDLGWIVVTGVLAFAAARVGARTLGPEIGALLGSLAVGLLSEVFARWRRRPAAVTLVPGILLLVPGSIGFESLSSFLHHETLAGVQAAFRTSLVAISLAGGLLLAAFVLPPRRSL